MIPTTKESTNSSSVLRQLSEPIADPLAEVERILKRELSSKYPYVDEIVRYGCLLGGKRLRPTLLLLTAQALGQVNQRHLVLAAVVEMIHTATLVHDDVLDDAELRRHLPTVNSRWDNEASILLGDFLFTHAFYLASTLGIAAACEMIGKATNIVCEGELRQKGCEGDFSLLESDYLEIVDAKTAELCACSCQLGSYFAQAPDWQTERLTAYGRDLGIAFQIADDLLDVVGDAKIVGKSLGTDLDQLKPTLPLIRALQVATDADRREMLILLQSDRDNPGPLLRPYLERYEALEYSRSKAEYFASRARERIQFLPSSDSQHVLNLLCDYVVRRHH